jgi:hypothetical protein
MVVHDVNDERIDVAIGLSLSALRAYLHPSLPSLPLETFYRVSAGKWTQTGLPLPEVFPETTHQTAVLDVSAPCYT